MKNIDLLIVEDNIRDAHLIKRILQKENLTQAYHWVNDGEEVIQYLKEDSNPLPKVIILDIKMPRLDGFGVLEVLKKEKRTSKIPIVMYSSSTQQSDIERAYSLGASSYLNKPARLQDMKDLFRNICEYWLRANKIVEIN